MTSVKKTVSVDEIVVDLKRGMSDEDLMTKYRLSEDGLKKLFAALLSAVCVGSSHVRVELED